MRGGYRLGAGRKKGKKTDLEKNPEKLVLLSRMDDILIGWKEISVFLKVSEKTARKYKKEKKLPVKISPAGHPIILKITATTWLLNHR